MTVGFWCPVDEARIEQRADDYEFSWSIIFPPGWDETTVTAGLIVSNPCNDPAQQSLSLDVILDGKLVGKLITSNSGDRNAFLKGSLRLGSLSKGQHIFVISCPSSEAILEGVWVTNGPFMAPWPGNHPALKVDRFFRPNTPRIVPQTSLTTLPLECGEQALAANDNQQGMIGIADGKVTAVPESLRLRYVDCELNVFLQTDEGYRRVKDICPNVYFSLLDSFLPCPITQFTHDDVYYEIVFAAIPDGEEAADMVWVKARNESKIPKPNAVRLLLDGAEGLTINNNMIISSGEVIAHLSSMVTAQSKTRFFGYADPKATVVAHAWATPCIEPEKYSWDISFLSGRIGWEGQPVKYCLRCSPGACYTVYMGLARLEWSNPGQKRIPAGEQAVVLQVEGAEQSVHVDCRLFPSLQPDVLNSKDFRKFPDPQVFRFDAQDNDGDGLISIQSMPDPAVPNAIGVLSAIWIFPPDEFVDTVELRQGKFNSKALHFSNVGGSAPGYIIDWVAGEDWSSTFAEITDSQEIQPGQTREFCVALPVNHRPEVICYSQPRRWREPDEGSLAYQSRLMHRNSAARMAAETPDKALDAVKKYWAQILNHHARYKVPESIVLNLMRSSYCYFRILRQKLTNNYFLPIGGGPMFYFDFSERDNGYEVASMDFTGRHKEAELLLNPFLTNWDGLKSPRWTLGQDEQGMWMTRAAEEDTQGQVLWALGEHFMLTRDRDWLNRAWPWIKRGLEYIRRKREEQKIAYPNSDDPRHGLWIAGTDESKSWGNITHSYYFSYWIECALRFGIIEAEALGEDAYGFVLRHEYADLLSCLRQSLRMKFFRFDNRRGILPDTVEKPGNLNVWGVQESLWPSHTLEPWDPMITQTLSYIDALAYPRTGGFPVDVGNAVWPSATCDYAMMHLRRGEGDRVVDCFYSMLSTCGNINSWCEVINFQDGRGTGEQPYMWANAAFLILLRHMLLHEESEWLKETPAGPKELWICPATPRKWLDTPEGIAVENAPSYFGPVSFTLHYDAVSGIFTIILKLTGDRSPNRVVVYLRTSDAREIKSVTINGLEHPYFSGEKVIIVNPPNQCEILAWV